MEKITGGSFDEERALYGKRGIEVINCRFEGPADGESALKESSDISVRDSYFDLRYPFWHDTGLQIRNCEMTEKCRAALWYSKDILIEDSVLHGIKALRECSDVTIKGCAVVSPEFAWSVNGIEIEDTSIESEYFLMRSEDVRFRNVRLTGKYSFQYVKNAVIEDCELNTKDAFWHAENVTVRRSVINGEYLGWYSKDLTLEDCIIRGTQPLCYCRGLKLINCEMIDCDLSFERSEVDADVKGEILSIKNPLSGIIRADGAGEIIRDDPMFKGKIICGGREI